VVSEEEVRGLDPQGWSFLNLNTPADYERVSKLITKPSA